MAFTVMLKWIYKEVSVLFSRKNFYKFNLSDLIVTKLYYQVQVRGDSCSIIIPLFSVCDYKDLFLEDL